MKHIDVKIEHSGNPPMTLVARIDHDQKDGYHIFTSEQIDGFVVSSSSLDKAVQQIPSAIKTLFRYNRDMRCTVELGLELSEGKHEEPSYALIKEAA